MLSPLETGTTLGATPGTWEEPGNRSLARMPGTGGRRGASKARQLAGPGAVKLDKAPHLIHGGPCLILPGRNVFFQDRHAGNRRNASRDDPGHGRSTGEVPTRPRRDRRQQARKPPLSAPRPKAAASIRGPGSCTISSGPGPEPGPEPRVRPAGCVTASTGALIGCCLPARQEDCLPAGCAQRCG